MFKPQPFGRYTLLDRLAIGGMAEIYLARLDQDPRLLVIKRMLPNFAEDQDFVEMFIDEAKISATLDHPNIVPVLDLGRVADVTFIAMEYVPGKDLQAVLNVLIDRQTQLGPDHVAFIGQEMMRGLNYAHNKTSGAGEPLHIVHRDVSPQNILISFEGDVKITDFGIAKAESKLNKTQAGILKGKFSYMSPEQVMGREIDNRHDIFSAGIILYELSAGRRLFTGKVEWEILQKVRLGHIDPLAQYNPNVPKALQKIIYRALTVDRDQRYENAQEMELDLVQYLGRFHPTYSHSELANLMQNLFEQDMQAHRQRVNDAISSLQASPKAEQGAALEATVAGEPPSGPPPRRGSGAHSVSPDIEDVVAHRLQTSNARIQRPAPPPTDVAVKAPKKKAGIGLWIVVAVLALLVVALGTLVGLQPQWLMNLIGASNEAPTPTATANAQPTQSVAEETLPPTEAATPEPTTEASIEPTTRVTTNTAVTGVVLVVKSDPPGEVFVDGEPRGQSPVTIEGLQLNQRYMVTVTREGYRTARRPWFSVQGETTLELPLHPVTVNSDHSVTPVVHEPGFLTVYVTNGTGRVFVNDALVKTTSPLVKHKLPPGKYTVRVENPTTNQSVEFQARIVAGETFVKRVRL